MRVLLVPNTANHEALQAARELAAWLPAQGVEPVLEVGDARETGLDQYGSSAAEIGEPALAVALGGDGTILKAVHLLGEATVPLLGVKYGRLGFLSGVRSEEVRPAIVAALAGEAVIERRTTLCAEVIMGGRRVGGYRAMNEVALSRSTSGRVVVFDVHVAGEMVERVRADGLVLATATGSTAYALSAGGPVVAPGFGGMIVVPVAPHTLQARALVTDPTDVVEVSFPEPARSDACLIVDGDVKPCRRSIERVTVRPGAHDVLLVKHGGRGFYATVAAEFFGA